MDATTNPLHQNGSSAPLEPSTTPAPGQQIVELDYGNEGFMIFASALLWILVPGCGFFYSGMAQSKSALSMITLSLWSVAIASIQWFLFGYSLSFSLTGGTSFIGNFHKAFYMGVGGNGADPNDTHVLAFPTASGVSEMSFCFYQGVTATLPAALLAGALAERARVVPAVIFIFLWNTLVYNPCAYWSLNPKGWSYNMGVLDFGGGAPVHVPAAAGALAYSYLLGPRNEIDRNAKPHNMLSLSLGTVFIWFGSFGYNSGSAFGATMQSLMSCVVTNLSGSVGAITWAMLDYIAEGKCNGFGFCAGAVVGLIVITPASGFVPPYSALPFGIIGSIICRWGHFAKQNWKFDDTLDVFAMHGLAGIVGILLTGVFADNRYGGDAIGKGGWVNGHWAQIFYQLEDTCAGFVWSFSISLILLFVMNKIPFLRLRMDADKKVDSTENPVGSLDEIGQGQISQIGVNEVSMDIVEMGLACYEHIEEMKVDSVNICKEDCTQLNNEFMIRRNNSNNCSNCNSSHRNHNNRLIAF